MAGTWSGSAQPSPKWEPAGAGNIGEPISLCMAALAALPGEPFVELGLAIKARSPAPFTFVVGSANDWIGYLARPQAWQQGGYEVSLGPLTRVGLQGGPPTRRKGDRTGDSTMAAIGLGVLVRLAEGPDEAMQKVAELGFSTCQVQAGAGPLISRETAGRLRQAADRHGVEITTIWAGLPGKHVWNFLEGPITIGLVPAESRVARVEALKRAAEFATWVGVPSITTHVGFIPENPTDPAYAPVVAALQEVAHACLDQGLSFWFETGQETPITLLRTMQDVGTGNLGINLDPANLLMYGKANPVDALDTIGRFVRGVHAKDGEYPTDGRSLGHEKPLGAGRVNFPVLVPKLYGLGFRGALTIEREISGPQQIADIKTGKQFLEQILANLSAA